MPIKFSQLGIMAKIQPYFSIILFAFSLVISVKCQNFEEFKKNLLQIKNFDILDEIYEIVFGNWSKDQQCSTEMKAIRNGLINSEEWAFKSKSVFFFHFFRLMRISSTKSLKIFTNYLIFR